MKFSHSLQIPMTANALLRAQQLLYEARAPLPAQLLMGKYPGYRGDYEVELPTPTKPPLLKF